MEWFYEIAMALGFIASGAATFLWSRNEFRELREKLEHHNQWLCHIQAWRDQQEEENDLEARLVRKIAPVVYDLIEQAGGEDGEDDE